MNFLRKIGNIGTANISSREQKKKIRILNYASVWAFINLGWLILFNLYHYNYLISLANAGALSFFVLILLLNRKQAFAAAKFVLFILFPVALLPFNYLLGEVGSENYFFVLIVLAFYLQDKAKYSYFLSVFYILCFFVVRLTMKLEFSLQLYQHLTEYYYWPNTLGSFISLTLISMVYTNENTGHLKRLNIQNTNLNKQNLYIKKLSRELNHRIKNNLQIVSGLFNLQRLNTENQEVNDALADAGKRIITIALLHKKLYQESSDSTEISVKEYIHDLCSFLIQSSDLNDNIDFTIEADNISIPIEDSVHVGLVINEAITNSIKYAFNKNHNKAIKVEYKQSGNDAMIKISDNGKGFPANFDPYKSDHFGIFLIKTIADYSDGSVSFYNDKGAVTEVRLKISKEIHVQ